MSDYKIPLLTLKNVTKHFIIKEQNKSTHVLDCISLDLKKGEIISIVGPSGCGKSTLLNVITGFDRIKDGEVLYKNQIIKGPSPERGIVFQAPALFPWLDVRDNIGYGLKIKKVNKKARDKQISRYVKQIGLEEFQYFYPSQLSGGMQQRVALARALIMNPKLLSMDEPFSALDYQSRLEMQGIMLKLWEVYKPTILFVTHDVEESILVADRVVVISKRPGKILKEFIVPFKRPRETSLIKDLKFNLLKVEILNLLL